MELINKIIDYNYGEFGTEFGNALVNLKNENIRLNNIIDEALGIANERINYYYHNKNDELLKEWEEIFEKLVKRDTELKGDNK